MARVDIPLPGKDKDYDSRKSRAVLMNLMVDTNKDGSFRAIIKREGSDFVVDTINADGIISNFVAIDANEAHFSGTSNIYQLFGTGSIADAGSHGFTETGRTVSRGVVNNVVPRETLFNYTDAVAGPSPDAVIFDGTTVATVTDANYQANEPISGAFLNSRFYFASTTNPDVFFASAVLDGFTYPVVSFAAADEIAGELREVRAYKSAMYVFTDRNIEYWQTIVDPDFPLRRVQGASHRQGIFSGALNPSSSIDQLRQYIGFYGSDNQVYLLSDGQLSVISDLDFSKRVDNSSIDSVIPFCFFIDGPYHKYFCVSSVDVFSFSVDTNLFTWVYDLTTGESHYRKSPTLDYWSAYHSVMLDAGLGQTTIFYREVPTAGAGTIPNVSPSISELSFNFFDDNGTDFECILQSGSLSFNNDVSIEYIEIEMETGVGNADSADPEMTVLYSKDGGENFTTWGTKKLGGSTDKSKRVRMNNFGRLVRHTDFILKLVIEEPVKIEIYGAYADITGGF